MTLKYVYGLLASPWYRVRPILPRHQSREAWLAYQKARGLNGDGTPIK